MPVTFDNSFGLQTNGAACQFNFTLGTNAVLLAFVSSTGNGVSVSAVAYAGVALTKLDHRAVAPGGTNVVFDIWALTAPAAGVNVLSAQFATSDNWRFIAASYLNVKAIGGFGTIQGNTGTSVSTNSFSLSSTTTDLCVFGYNGAQGLTATVAGVTERGSAGVGSMKIWDVAGTGPTLSVSCSASAASTYLIGTGLSLQFSAISVSTRFFRALTGVGY